MTSMSNYPKKPKYKLSLTSRPYFPNKDFSEEAAL